MGKLIGGILLALWGVGVLVYGMNQPKAGGAYGAGQTAASVVAVVMLIGGVTLAVQGSRQMNAQPGRRRSRYDDDEDDEDDRPRRRRSRSRDDDDDDDDRPSRRRR